MPVTVEQSIDDPIVTFNLVGTLDAATLTEMSVEAARLLEEMGTYYAIVDVDNLDNSEKSSVAIDAICAKAGLVDPRITMVIVGQRTETAAIPGFPDQEAAADYIRQVIATHASGNN
jgi:hypothetical protein